MGHARVRLNVEDVRDCPKMSWTYNVRCFILCKRTGMILSDISFLQKWMCNFRRHVVEAGCSAVFYSWTALARGGICWSPRSSSKTNGSRHDWSCCEKVDIFKTAELVKSIYVAYLYLQGFFFCGCFIVIYNIFSHRMFLLSDFLIKHWRFECCII